MPKILYFFKIVPIIFLFAWISFFPEPVQGQYFVAVRGIMAVFLAFFLLGKNRKIHLFSIADWPLWLFLTSLSVNVFFAMNRDIAFNTYTYLVITFFLLFYIGKSIFNSSKDRMFIGMIICTCACVIVFIGFLELHFGKNILYEKFIDNPFYERYIRCDVRMMSTQFNPSVLASFILGCLPFCFYLAGAKTFFPRKLGIISLILCVSGIILGFSRGVFLGLIAMSVFYLWNAGKRKWLIAMLLGFILFISFCSFQKNTNISRFGFHKMVYGYSDSIVSGYRLQRVEMALKMFKEQPFAGIGLNHFRLRFNEFCRAGDSGNEIYEFMIPDNMYLTFLAETGLIGTFGFLIFIFFLFKRGFKKMKEAHDKQALLVPMSALAGLLANMGAYELFYWNNPYMLFCVICGFIYGAAMSESDA